MPVVAVFAFVDSKALDVMIVFGYPSGQLGFFFGGIANLVGITNPAALRLVGLTWF